MHLLNKCLIDKRKRNLKNTDKYQKVKTIHVDLKENLRFLFLKIK